MSLASCMRSLGLRNISKVDGWTQHRIATKELCRFVELRTRIEGSSCGELVASASGGPGQ
jgi:hypothetical protein